MSKCIVASTAEDQSNATIGRHMHAMAHKRISCGTRHQSHLQSLINLGRVPTALLAAVLTTMITAGLLCCKLTGGST
eukprot:1158867-Pelagomonas_calceolata.AAC.4